MMAVAKGKIRAIEALLESPRIQMCKGLPYDQLHTARSMVRELTTSPFKIEVLRKLKARPVDAPIFENWIKGVALEHLTMKFALSKKNRKFVEFLIHNCVEEINPEWILHAVVHSNAELLEILIDEFSGQAIALNLTTLLNPKDPVFPQKKAAVSYLDNLSSAT